MKLAAEMYDFDTMLIALNHQEQGKQPFEEQPVPFASKKGMGVLAMKVIRPRETVNGLAPDDLIKYALSLKDVTAAVIGTDSVDVLNKNIATLQSFKPLSALNWILFTKVTNCRGCNPVITMECIGHKFQISKKRQPTY
jgi:predicted aldo/keto reductase-like oxidoreductase